jgi:hypothetical protein
VSPVLRQVLFYGVWAVPVLVQSVLLALLLTRGVSRRFPWFTVYLAVDLVLSSSLILIYIAGNRPVYTFAYIIYVVAGAVLVFAALFEVVGDTFSRLPELLRLQRMVLGWGAALIIIVTVLLSLTAQRDEGPLMVQSALILERGVRLSQFLLILLLLAVSRIVKVSWTSFTAGIVLGFGLFAACDLLLLALHSRWGAEYPFGFHLARGVVANLQLVIWLVWLLRQPIAETPRLLFATSDRTLLEWEGGLAHLRGHDAAYLADLQRVVDRVMDEHSRQ